jgi:threonine dehydrogenase-like Zn-dependent dehydrogenase
MAVTGLAGKGYAQYVSANQHHLVRIPEGVGFEQALGEPLGCVMSGARRTRVDMGDTVAVVGLGFMGLLALQAIRLRGPAYLIAVDPRPHAREMACRLGADVACAPEEVDAKWKLTEWNQLGKGYGVDVAIEASGTQAGLTLAGQMVHEHGMLSLVGYHQGGPRLVDMELWNWKAVDILNAHERRTPYLVECIARGLALVKAGRLDIGMLVTHRFPLECVDEAFAALQTKPDGFVKAVIVPE